MDWPVAPPGWHVQEAVVDSATMVRWGVLIWAEVAATLALLLPIPTQAVRRRRSCLDRDGRALVPMTEFREMTMIAQRFDRRPVDELDPENWWGDIDGEILDWLRERGSATVKELSQELGLSEGAATAFLAMLAREGRVRIVRVELVA